MGYLMGYLMGYPISFRSLNYMMQTEMVTSEPYPHEALNEAFKSSIIQVGLVVRCGQMAPRPYKVKLLVIEIPEHESRKEFMSVLYSIFYYKFPIVSKFLAPRFTIAFP